MKYELGFMDLKGVHGLHRNICFSIFKWVVAVRITLCCLSVPGVCSCPEVVHGCLREGILDFAATHVEGVLIIV